MHKMKSFKQYLNEARGTSLSDLIFLPRIGAYDQLMIPISSSMYKRIWPDTLRATVFHTTDEKGVKKIAKLQGKKSQISAFFEMQSRYMEVGVATQGGVHSVLEMDADVLLSAKGDIMSHLDQSGRRWTSISDLKETSRGINFSKVQVDLERMFSPLVSKYLARGEFQDNTTIWELWRMAKRKVDGKTMSLIIKDYMDGMEKVIKKNIDTFSSVMMSYAKKRTTDLSWDEQVVNNIKVKTAHFFKLPIPIAQTDDQIEMSEKQQELIEFANSKGWKVKVWGSATELEIYTRKVAKKELSEMKSFKGYLNEDVSKSDLDQVEKYADRLFAAVGIDIEFTRHFLDRVNDERNKKPISTAELIRLFRLTYKKYGKKISKMNPDAEAVIHDMETDVNLPFVLNIDKSGMLDLVAKTVMRKKNFKTNDQKLEV